MLKLTVLWVLILLGSVVFGSNPELYTAEEIIALDELRPLVQTMLHKDYMKTDEYLINWIPSVKLDVDKAAKKIQNSIKWRLENQIDDILEDDSYQDGKAYIPYSLEGYDKFRRPRQLFGKWNVRKLALSGKRGQFRKQVQSMMEFWTREARAQGKNVTQSMIVCDMTGFSLRVHGCLQCMRLYADWIMDFDAHYPLSIKEAIIFNAPTAYVNTIQLLRPLMSPALRDIFKIFGYDKAEYTEFIYKTISPDQISPEFGGIKNAKMLSDDQ